MDLPQRFMCEWKALTDRADETVEVTRFGGPREFLSLAPTTNDYWALARRAYLRGDLTVEEFEHALELAPR